MNLLVCPALEVWLGRKNESILKYSEDKMYSPVLLGTLVNEFWLYSDR